VKCFVKNDDAILQFKNNSNKRHRFSIETESEAYRMFAAANCIARVDKLILSINSEAEYENRNIERICNNK
jgi:hypothetical protein